MNTQTQSRIAVIRCLSGRSLRCDCALHSKDGLVCKLHLNCSSKLLGQPLPCSMIFSSRRGVWAWEGWSGQLGRGVRGSETTCFLGVESARRFKQVEAALVKWAIAGEAAANIGDHAEAGEAIAEQLRNTQ
jgi:hypothetical protein